MRSPIRKFFAPYRHPDASFDPSVFSCWRSVCCVLILLLCFTAPCLGQTNETVNQMVIQGNHSIQSDQIQRLMITKAAGFFGPGKLNMAILRADVDAIEKFYQNSGFLDVRARFSRDASGKNRVNVRIMIDEGPRFIVKAIHITGAKSLSEKVIRKNLLSRVGLPYYRIFVAADRRYIQALSDRQALLDARVQVESIRSESDTSMTISFLIDEGAPIRVGKVQLRGLQKTQPFVILREIELHKGDLYDTSKLSRSQTRLFQTGLFRSVRMEPIRSDSTSSSRELLISVTELPGGEFSFGGGFASVEKFRGSFSLVHRNWLGRAITIGTNAQASLLTQQVDAGVTQPWLFKTRTTGTFRGFFLRQDRRSYVQKEFGASVLAIRELTRSFRSQTTYTIKTIAITSVSDSLRQTLQSASVADSLRSRREGSLTQQIIFDTRDDLLNPARGAFVQVQGSLASPWLGNSSANKNSTFTINGLFRKYFPIRRFPDFATSLSLSYVRALSNGVVPLDKRLLLGGDKSVRGFGIDQIGQPDGGILAISSQNEIRASLLGMVLAGFIDLGGISRSVGSFGLSDLQVGYGAGLRVNSPIGLIRGDVGFHQKGSTDSANAGLYARTFFYFGLGQAF